MRFLKNLELEWKILILACLVFAAFAWPVQHLFITRLTNTLNQSIDTNLEPILRDQLEKADEKDRENIIACIKRNRQWRALIPIVVKEQQKVILAFSFGLFILLFVLAFWTLRRLTRPLKNLAFAVDKIGRGEKSPITPESGGALGRLEKAVTSLSEELDLLREKARIQGMEAAWQDIARVMAHEIKNPLTPIRLTLDRIEEKSIKAQTISGNDLDTFLERINSQVDNLERLVNQFRSFSREPEVNLKMISLPAALQTVANDMEHKIKTDIRCSGNLLVDPYLFNQALLNIWKNSLEAGASIIVVGCKQRPDKVNIIIKDNGPGLSASDIERVWLPYVTLKKGGTGLGLPVVKKLVETMGGTIDFESDTFGKEHGFTIILSFVNKSSGEEK